MADYCTITEIEGWLPNGQTLDDQTENDPKRATVLLWIPKYTAIVEAALARQGETVPLTGNRATEVGVLTAREIAYQIMTVRNQKEEVTDGDATFLNWHKEFLTLIGATEEAAAGEEVAQPTVRPFGFPDSTTESVFKREQARNW